jgi:hypothetical protein
LENSFLTGNDTVISHFEVIGNTTWGRYALCNRNVCEGGDQTTIGHEAAMGLTANGGQCRANPDVGEWYSLTNVTHCPAGVMPSSNGNGCAWQVKRRVKSVGTPCLVGMGLRKACQADANGQGIMISCCLLLM